MSQQNQQQHDFDCLVKDCRSKFKFCEMLLYARHLTGQHSLPINLMYLKFQTKDEFDKWRTSEQTINECMFIPLVGNEKFCICHRSQFIVDFANEDKLIHKQDEHERLYKIKAPCPAHFSYRIKDDGIHVMYARTHYGYCIDLKNNGISTKATQMVLEESKRRLLQSAKDYEDILDRVRKKIAKEDRSNPDYLITLKHVIDIIGGTDDSI